MVRIGKKLNILLFTLKVACLKFKYDSDLVASAVVLKSTDIIIKQIVIRV